MTLLYKFRRLTSCDDLDRIESIIEKGFYCSSFLEFNDMNEGVYVVSKKRREVTFEEKQECRICSFSKPEALKSPLMWGHYAEAGMGVAIEINAGDHDDIRDVVYGKYEPVEIIDILTHKTKEWEYEKESRYITTDPKAKCFPFFKIKISNILFGTPYKYLRNYEEVL